MANPRDTKATLPDAGGDSDAPPPPVAIGRYQVLGVVGTGGMGMVFGAWDPELDRRVALKLLKHASAAARERMMREGQLLARLSHPNVVPVFDVGQTGDQVYLVMEYVKGTTLATYAATKPGVDALLAAYREAGAGLAAAHRAGVIHRDFKPSNAIRGDDDRVRVLDFGIAYSEGTAVGDAAGTPHYMAPEQLAKQPLTAAVDQYAFCVSLREALGDQAPAWVAAILARGTEREASERFATMDALLGALARDPARRRRRMAVGAGAVAAAAAAFAVGWGMRDPVEAVIEPCAGGAGELARSWTRELNTRMAAHLDGLRAGEGTRLANELERDATAWVGEFHDACMAHERKELTVGRYEVRLDCLARTRAAIGAVAEVASVVDRAGLDSALTAARMRPDVRGCRDVSEVEPPPAAVAARVAEVVPAIERALVLVNAWRVDALPAAEKTASDARAIGYGPVVARALVVYGRALDAANRDDAAAILDEAMRVALAANDDALAVEAYARWVYRMAIDNQPTFDKLDVMRVIGARLGARGRFARALLHNNVGIAHLTKRDTEAALAAYRAAAAEDAPELEVVTAVGQNLANLETTPEASLGRMKETYERYVAAVGSATSEGRVMHAIVAMMTPDDHAARALYGTCDGVEGEPYLQCMYEGAWLADAAGDMKAAARMMEVVAGDPRMKVVANSYIAAQTGALSSVQRSELDAVARQPLGGLFEASYVGDANVLLARQADPSEALLAWERATKAFTSTRFAVHRRRQARAERELAIRLALTRPSDAAQYALRALPWVRLTSDRALIARLEAIATNGSR